jgi:chemotaxis family two-component system sensor kinase Cph1
VRLLIGEHQLVRFRGAVNGSREPVAVADASGSLLFSNLAFNRLMALPAVPAITTVSDFANRFGAHDPMRNTLRAMVDTRQACRGQGLLDRAASDPLLVGVRAEVVPGRDGALLGFVITMTDLSERQRAADARRHLEQSLTPGDWAGDDVISAILTNASVAALDIVDGPTGPTVVPLLGEVEESTQRAQALYEQIRGFLREE